MRKLVFSSCFQRAFKDKRKERIDKRRQEIAKNAEEALKEVELGTAKRGTFEEIKAYLLEEEE